MAKLHEISTALRVAGLPVGGLCGLHDVAAPASFIRCGGDLWRIDWDGAPSSEQELLAVATIAQASGHDAAILKWSTGENREDAALLAERCNMAEAGRQVLVAATYRRQQRESEDDAAQIAQLKAKPAELEAKPVEQPKPEEPPPQPTEEVIAPA